MVYGWLGYARFNLLSNLIKLDNKTIYADTDSLKLEAGFDQNVIDEYNMKVLEKIKKVSNDLKIPIEKFSPVDKDGNEHTIGLFDLDGEYKQFKTLGAKKYAYIDNNDELHITVSGVPKQASKALKNLDEFKNDFVFKYEDTGKNMIAYNENQNEFILTDYNGLEYKVTDKYGICILPTTYKLGISEEYFELITNESSNHSVYKE